MLFFITRIFRGINARLINTDNLILEKVYKVCFALSIVFYRRFRFASVKQSVVIIDNYDQTIKMKIDRTRSMGAAIFWTGFHEFREFIFLHHFLAPDMVFVDVGANQGEYALFAAKRLVKGSVLAFEPLPSIRTLFQENIALNQFNNIQVVDKGLADGDASLTIHEIEDRHEGLATVYLGDRKSKQAYTIQLIALDDFINAQSVRRVDIIKIDIEGGELKALQGSKATIEKFKPVVMIEINEQTYTAAGYQVADVANFFKALHYRPYEIMKRGRLSPIDTLPAFGNIVYKPE